MISMSRCLLTVVAVTSDVVVFSGGFAFYFFSQVFYDVLAAFAVFPFAFYFY